MLKIFVILISESKIAGLDLNKLTHNLKAVFQAEVQIEVGLKLPEEGYHRSRDQWLAGRLIEALPDRDGLILGITTKDIFAPNLNFLFGQAHPHTGKAIISTFRLRPEFYGREKDDVLFNERILKEAVHELGHIFLLSHCPDKSCIMHFSNTIYDTDQKGPGFCERCLLYLEKSRDLWPEGKGRDRTEKK